MLARFVLAYLPKRVPVLWRHVLRLGAALLCSARVRVRLTHVCDAAQRHVPFGLNSFESCGAF